MRGKNVTSGVIVDDSQVAAAFYERLIAQGISSMSKSLMEVTLVYCHDQVTARNNKGRCETDYNLSLRLKMTVTKVRRLRHEAALHFSASPKHEAMMRFIKALTTTQNDQSRDRIAIQVRDPLAKAWCIGVIDEGGTMHDTSHNRDILYLSVEGFLHMLEVMINDLEDLGATDLVSALKVLRTKVQGKKLVEDVVGAIAGVVGVLQKFVGAG